LAGIASAMLKNARPATSGTPTAGSSPATATFTPEQIDQLAGALGDAVGRIEIPPAQVSFPPNLQLAFSDAELARIAQAIAGASSTQTKLIETRVLTADFDGSILTNSIFPTLQRVTSYQFVQDYYMIASTLSSSIVNVGPDVAGFFFGRDLGEFVDIGQQSDTQTASDIFISQITHQNSTLTTIAPLSRTNTIAFGGDNVFVPVQAGTRLALYACGTPGNAGYLYTATVHLHLIAK